MREPKIFGLLGLPLKHSLSPAMHNAAIKALKVNAKYKLFERSEQSLKTFLKSLHENGVYGINVTVPYKEKVIQYLKSVEPAVRSIGACNTIVVNKNGSLRGFNTDYLGFARHLKDLKLKPQRAAIIGAGGAAKAIVYALAGMGAKEILLYDIDSFKSVSLAGRLGRAFENCRISAAARAEELKLVDKDILVNASYAGLKESDPSPVDPSKLHRGLFVYDLIYNPAETKLIRAAKERDIPYANGLNMLLYQGAESFNIWMKPKKAPVEVMRKALLKALR